MFFTITDVNYNRLVHFLPDLACVVLTTERNGNLEMCPRLNMEVLLGPACLFLQTAGSLSRSPSQWRYLKSPNATARGIQADETCRSCWDPPARFKRAADPSYVHEHDDIFIDRDFAYLHADLLL
jgi:hypothetical protein